MWECTSAWPPTPLGLSSAEKPVYILPVSLFFLKVIIPRLHTEKCVCVCVCKCVLLCVKPCPAESQAFPAQCRQARGQRASAQ